MQDVDLEPCGRQEHHKQIRLRTLSTVENAVTAKSLGRSLLFPKFVNPHSNHQCS